MRSLKGWTYTFSKEEHSLSHTQSYSLVEQVVNGNAMIMCNDVTPLKIELTAERAAIVVNTESQKSEFSHSELLAYYTASEVRIRITGFTYIHIFM